MGKVGIYNLGFILLGLDPVSSVDEDNIQVKTFNGIYDIVLNTLLTEEPWNFSLKRVRLPQVENIDLLDCEYTYQYPSYCLQVVDSSTDIEIVGDKVCSNEQGLKITYIHEPSNLALYPVGFLNCLSYNLALTACYKLTQSNSRETNLYGKYKEVLAKAKSLDSQQQTIELEPMNITS